MANEYLTSEGAFSNTPLENVFDPLGPYTKIADIGYSVNGTDISNLYAPLAVGSATTATGFRVGGSDLNTLFAGIGTASPVDLDGSYGLVALKIGGVDGTTSMTFTLNSTGIVQITRAGATAGNGTTTEGTWLIAGANSDYEARAQITSGPTNGGSSTGTFNAWQVLSSGRAWGLSLNALAESTMEVTVSIRDVATETILATTSLSYQVTIEN